MTPNAQPRTLVTPDVETATLPLPPKASGRPLVGVLPEVLTQQINFLPAARAKYGDIYRLSFGPQTIVILNGPNHAQHVFRDNVRNYRKGGKFWDTLRQVIGNGLAVSEGDYWLRQRRMMQPQFHRQRLSALTDLMAEAAAEGLQAWQAFGSSPFDLAHAYASITLKIIARTMFGSGLTQDEIDRVARAVIVISGYIMQGALTNNLPKWLPLPGARAFERANQVVDEVLRGVIDRSRPAERESRYEDNLISMLLNMVDEETGECMTPQQIRDEAITIFLAGYETTASTLTWTTHLLMQHPAIQAKVKAEIDAVLSGQTPTFESVARLPYTRMALQESMRLYPPVWWLPRTAVEDDIIDGYRIPAGTNVVIPIYVIHRHPNFWDRPEEFNPERFAPTQSADRHPFAWIPFGAGPRVCLGRDFALIEAPLVLAMTLQRCAFTPVPGRTVAPQLSSTLRPKGGLWVRLESAKM